MDILVCIKRVPDTSENEIELNDTGTDILREDLVFSVNEWDNYALEEAIQIAERTDGSVTVATVGDTDSEDVLRRALAMGADKALLLSDAQFAGLDGCGIAAVLRQAAGQGAFQLILTGTQADDGAAQVGGMLAAMLDYPFASLVNNIEIKERDKLMVRREIEGGDQEVNEIDLPCVLSIQTGINEPRYVGVRNVRKVASVEIPCLGAADLGLSADALASKVQCTEYVVPEQGEGAEMLEGSTDAIIARLLEMLKAKGGIK